MKESTCQWTIWLRRAGKCRGISELSKNAMASLCVFLLTLVVDVFDGFYVVVLVINVGLCCYCYAYFKPRIFPFQGSVSPCT